MRATEQPTEDPRAQWVCRDRPGLEQQLAQALQGQPPARLLVRLTEAVGGQDVLLLSSDLQPLGFGAYRGQLCVVTPTAVVLVTATELQGEEAAFGLEQWPREVGVLPRALPHRPGPPAPRQG